MSFRIQRFDEHLKVPWKNGLEIIREVISRPVSDGSGGFDWRISLATVGASGPRYILALSRSRVFDVWTLRFARRTLLLWLGKVRQLPSNTSNNSFCWCFFGQTSGGRFDMAPGDREASYLATCPLYRYTVFEKQYNDRGAPMKSIDLMYQTMLAELGQRSLDAAWTADFPPEGRFTPANIKGRKYWYFDIPDGHGGTKRRYIGPAEDPDIARRVADHKRDKDDLRARRRLVNTLTREGGMIAPDAMSGDIVEALAEGGLFRLRGVLIGTVAFQCYSGLLGVRLPMAAILTGDADIAQDYAISREVEDSLPPIVELLQGVDDSFRPVPHRLGSAASSAFQNADGYRVEFLTSNRGSDDYIDQPTKMPALGGASADPLRFLDFLIRESVRTMLLHRSGVPVVVPDPSRYAVHKLIVASRRHTGGQALAKREKDVRQAALLFEALQQTRRSADLALVYNEAWERGPEWQEGIRTGVGMLPPQDAERFKAVLIEGAKKNREEIELPFGE